MASVNDRTAPLLDAMALDFELRRNRQEDALKLAKESVARRPKDVLPRLNLANVMLRLKQPEEAIGVLLEATQDFAEDNRVWPALVNAYIQARQIDNARDVLNRLVTSSTLPEETRHYIAAQGFQRIGDLESARQQYVLAIEQQPSATEIRLKYAQLLATRSPRAALDVYEQILGMDPVNDAARRGLAMQLAATGDENDWERATQLLTLSAKSSSMNSRDDDRLRH